MNTYRFEDLTVGQNESFEVSITSEMMDAFLRYVDDTNPLHNDAQFAIEQGYKDRVVYGMISASLISKLVGVLLPGKYCLLQGVETKFLGPVYIGDTLSVSGTVSELHASVKQAVIKVEIRNQDGQKVLRGKTEVGFLKESKQ